MYKLREVYAMFCEEHGTIVGFSTFCNLRPVNVLLSRSTPHDMCLCQTHEKFISLTNALLPAYNQQWIVENAVCQWSLSWRVHAQSLNNLQRRHKIEGSYSRKARVWRRSLSVSMAEGDSWWQVEKSEVDNVCWWCSGVDPRCTSRIPTPCVCEKVSGGGIPAGHRRKLCSKMCSLRNLGVTFDSNMSLRDT